MRTREQLAIAMPWMPCAPQGVKRFDDHDSSLSHYPQLPSIHLNLLQIPFNIFQPSQSRSSHSSSSSLRFTLKHFLNHPPLIHSYFISMDKTVNQKQGWPVSQKSTSTTWVRMRGALPPYLPNVVLVQNISEYRPISYLLLYLKACLKSLKIRNRWNSKQQAQFEQQHLYARIHPGNITGNVFEKNERTDNFRTNNF